MCKYKTKFTLILSDFVMCLSVCICIPFPALKDERQPLVTMSEDHFLPLILLHSNFKQEIIIVSTHLKRY